MSQQEAEWALWMAAANAGDRVAYHRLLTALAPLVTTIVRHCLLKYGQDDSEVDDIVQDCFLTLHLKRHLWDPSRPLVPWLRALITNKCVDCLRRKGSPNTLPIDDFENILPAEVSEPPVAESDLNRLVASLKGRSRDVLDAVALQGMTVRAAAAALGLSEGNARVALHRGVKALADLRRRTRA